MKMNPRFTPCLLAAFALVIASGCGSSESTPASGSTQPPPPMPAAQQASQPQALPPGHPSIDMAAQQLPAAAMAQGANPQWTVPTGWQPGPASSARRGSWVVKGADGQAVDIAVSAFPGDVGGLLANINRWRGQIGMGPITPDQIGSITSSLDAGGVKATVVDFSTESAPPGKTQPQRMVVVTLPREGNSWFFKLTGDAPLVAAQKDALLEFVKSVKF